MKKKIYSNFRKVGIKFDIINHHFMLGFVISGLYFVQNENNFINPLSQLGSGSGGSKSTDLDPAGQNQRIRPDPDPHPWLYP